MREKKRDDNYEIVLVRSDTYALDGEFTADQLATHSDARALRKAITGDDFDDPELFDELIEEVHVPSPSYAGMDIGTDAVSAEIWHQQELDRIAAAGSAERRELPSWADASRAISIARQNRFIRATNKLMRVAIGETDGPGFVPPDPDEPAYAVPKAATGFAVTSLRRRNIKSR